MEGGKEEDSEAGGEDTDSDEEEEEEDRRRLRLKNYSPKLTVKTFHPTRANLMLTPSTLAANTVVSNHTSMMINVNNGFGCERHRTTTESPPSDLITRLMEYRKNMTMYRQTAVAAIQKRKKIERKKVLEDSSEENSDPADDSNEESDDDGAEGASSSPIDLLLMLVFLRKIPQFFSVDHFQSSHCRLQ